MSRRLRLGAILALAALWGAAGATAQPPDRTPSADVTARATVDRTAMFVGDHLTYTVELICRRGTDILIDDVSRDKVKTEGLDVVASDTDKVPIEGNATRYTIRYTLTTYKVDAASVKVGPMSVRYYVRRPGQRPEDVTPAGAVQVPAAVVAFRSVLPEGEGWHEIRDNRPFPQRPALVRELQPIGIALIVIAVAPVAFAIVAIADRLRRRRRMDPTRSRRQARSEARALLQSVRDVDPESPAARREAFDALDTLVRQHVADTSGVAARSLTPDEIATALSEQPTRVPADAVKALLAQCELARYAPPDRLPSAELWRETLSSAEQVLAIH